MVKVIDSTEEERKRESDRQAALGLVKDFVKEIAGRKNLDYNLEVHSIGGDIQIYDNRSILIHISPVMKQIRVSNKDYFNDAMLLAQKCEQDLLRDRKIEYVVRKEWIGD